MPKIEATPEQIAAAASVPGIVIPVAGGSSGPVVVTRTPTLTMPGAGNGTPIRSTPNGTQPPELAGSDFIVLNEPKKQTVGIVYARDGHGKTTLAVDYCPDPVVLIGLDRRGERAAKLAINKGRRVYYMDASMPGNVLQMSHEQAQASGRDALAKITKNFELAVRWSQEGKVRTICIDTSSELRDIVRVAVRGRVDRVQEKGQGDFGKSDALINRTLKYFTDTARDGNANLLLMARAKSIYEGREDTGRITHDTDKQFVAAADWIVQLRMVSASVSGLAIVGAVLPGMQAAPPRFEIEATNPKLNILETGAVYREEDWVGVGPFAFMCSKIVPGSVPDDWR